MILAEYLVLCFSGPSLDAQISMSGRSLVLAVMGRLSLFQKKELPERSMWMDLMLKGRWVGEKVCRLLRTALSWTILGRSELPGGRVGYFRVF